MAAGWFSYADAVKLLGAGSRTVEILDRLTGGLLLAATGVNGDLVLSLFDAKGELARLSRELSTVVGDRSRGLGRYRRTQRIAAAHAVIVVAAFFEAVRHGEHHFGEEGLRLLKSEQMLLAGGTGTDGSRLGELAEQLLRADLPCPGPAQPYEFVLDALDSYYRQLTLRLLAFVRGLRVWDRLDEPRRDRVTRWLEQNVPAEAREHYVELFHRLGTEVPEIAYWTDRVDHRSTRGAIRELDTGVRDLRRLLESVASGTSPRGVRDALSRAYRTALDKPIISITDLPRGVRIPSLADAYVSPCFRLTVADSAAKPAEDHWWSDLPVQEDLRAFLFGYLTHPSATRLPLLVLGQPGAGKSVLTKIIATQLPAGEFIAVRVPLREAATEQDLQTQIEHAVRQETGESVNWPTLHTAGTDTVAVVLLDGFDELLQATGVSNSDYLEKVAMFQEREAAQGRPTVVVVTSRTAVADRARLPLDTVVIRLEPFLEEQVEQWCSVWNHTNSAYFERRALLLLRPETVMALGDLASQPLLLLMIALYDVDGNPLRHEAGQLGRTELYEKLLVRFARREVMKSGRGLTDREIDRAVDAELLRLSIVAFAMFNRDSQWATESELDADLRALLPESARSTSGFRAPLDPGQLVVGRFFFVHESQAVQDGRELKTFEFLHATFGEYLVARLTSQEIAHLIAASELNAGRARRVGPDDDFLHALLSHSPLSLRGPVLEFLKDLTKDLSAESRVVLKDTLLALFHEALHFRSSSAFDSYAPGRGLTPHRAAPTRFAVYSLNLLLLLVLACEEVQGKELFPDSIYTIGMWRSITRLWRSQLGYDAWMNLVYALDVQRCWRDEERELIIRATDEGTPDLQFPDPYWTYGMAPGSEERGHSSVRRGDFLPMARHLHFLCGYDEDVLLHTVEPLAADLGRSLLTFVGYWPDRAVSPANALLRLWLLSSRGDDLAELARAYADCLWVSQSFAPSAEEDALRYLDTVLGHLKLDADRLRGVLALENLHLRDDEPRIVMRVRTAMSELGLA